MDQVGVGIIGWGLAGERFHGAFVRAVEGLSVVTVATRRTVDAALYPGVRVVASPEEVIGDPRVDLVVVASPNRLHVPQARAALEAGKHVVIEKPIARSADEAAALFSLARKMNCLAVPFQNRRFDGDFLTVQRLIASGALGQVHAFESAWPTYRPSPAQRSAWKAEADPMHGILYDLGPHLIDQALVLFGRPTTVFGRVQANRPGGEVPDRFDITLGYEGRLSVRLRVDQLDPFEPPRFEVRGSAGAYQKHGIDAQEALLRAGELPGEPWGVEDPAAHGRLVTPEGTRTIPTEPGDYRAFYRAVRDAITEDRPCPIDPEDIVLQLRIIEAAIASSASGRAVEVSS